MAALDYYSRLSPFTSYLDESCAEDTIDRPAIFLESHNSLCNLTYVSTGGPVFNEMMEYVEDNIVSPWSVDSYADSGPKTIYYDVPFQDGTAICIAICIAGTYYEYDDRLLLSFVPCPIDTFRNLHNRSRVKSTCLPCPKDAVVSIAGSTYCTQPIDENFNEVSNGIQYNGYDAAASILGFLILASIFVFGHRKNKVIRSSQPLFL